MSDPTVQDHLNSSNINSIADALRSVKIGEVIPGLIPRWISKTGLASSATQMLYDGGSAVPKKQPLIVLAVTDGSDAHLDIVAAGAGAGKVVVAYDADAVPTFTFSGAVTAFKVLGCVLPKNLSTILINYLGYVAP